MKRIAGAVTILLSLAFAASANAQPPRPETITMNLTGFLNFPAAPPYVSTYDGTFQASGAINDTGGVTAHTLFAAVPSPSTAVLETYRTLTGSDGTLSLRCSEIAKLVADLSGVPGTGTCAVIGATGMYAGLTGSGKVTSTADLITGTFQETLVLGAV